MNDYQIIQASASAIPLADGSAHAAFTSVPYWSLRKYDAHDNPESIGLEKSPDEWCERLVACFREVRRVLRDDGTMFCNVGTAYAGSMGGGGPSVKQDSNPGSRMSYQTKAFPSGFKPKDLIPLPWLLGLALQKDGWYLRADIPWVKRSPMPESVTDRPSKACETVLMFSKRANYWWDAEAVKRKHVREWDENNGGSIAGNTEWQLRATGQSPRNKYPLPDPGGRNFRQSDLFMDSVRGLLLDDDGDPLAVVTSSEPSKLRHYALFPPKLVEPFVLAAVPHKVCAACGGGWKRITKRERKATRPGTDSKSTAGWNQEGRELVIGNRDPQRHCTEVETVGFEPGCSCGETATVPGILLDPFSGLASAGIACLRHGRRYVGVELSAEYAEKSRRRLAKFTRPATAPPVEVVEHEMPLWADLGV